MERLKAIWHIIIDKEYVVFTASLKNGKIKRACGIVSDSASSEFLEAVSKFTRLVSKTEKS